MEKHKLWVKMSAKEKRAFVKAFNEGETTAFIKSKDKAEDDMLTETCSFSLVYAHWGALLMKPEFNGGCGRTKAKEKKLKQEITKFYRDNKPKALSDKIVCYTEVS